MSQLLRPLFGSKQVLLRSTPKPITPFGGLVSFLEFLQRLALPQQLAATMPFQLRSPNAIPPAHTLTAFMLAVIAGARRFAHTDWLRADKALHALLGIRRFPGTDTIRNFFRRFSQSNIESFWRPLFRWVLEKFSCPTLGFSLDLDSTIFQRAGRQQGAAKGYNPRRPGRRSHHPLLAVLAEAPCVLHGWLRSGNTSSARGVVAFLREAFALLPPDWRLRTVRADSGFFDEELLEFLEERALAYVIVARLTRRIKQRAAALQAWTLLDAHYAVGEFRATLLGWKHERRFVVVREQVRERKEAVGRKLLEVPGYTFRIFVTNRAEEPLALWRDYNRRATVEQRIEELKNDLAADDFCMQPFFATESAFLAVLMSFNLLSLYQQQIAPGAAYRQPATLRTAVFLCGAVLGGSGRRAVLYLSAAWGGLDKHNPLMESVMRLVNPTSPKLVSSPSP